MKIIHIITGLDQGGSEEMLYKVLKNSGESQKDLMVISLKGPGVYGEKIKELGVPVYCLGIKGVVTALTSLSRYRSMVKKFNPDIIQAWMYHANLFSLVAKPFSPGRQYFWNIRQTLYCIGNEKKMTGLVIKLCSFFSRYSHKIVYNSKVSIEQHQRFGFCSKKSYYIPNGFDTNLFKRSPKVYQQFRLDNQLKPSTKIIGLFARFHPMKNHEGFLLFASEIKKSYGDDVIFVMAGTAIDVNNTQLNLKIKKYGLVGNILLLGRVDSSKFMPVLDVLVSTSSWGEAFSNVLGEALSCGIPCVSTDIGDAKEIILDATFSVQPRDMISLANKVKKILQLSDGEYSQLSQKCRERVINKYSIEHVTQCYAKIYSTYGTE